MNYLLFQYLIKIKIKIKKHPFIQESWNWVVWVCFNCIKGKYLTLNFNYSKLDFLHFKDISY